MGTDKSDADETLSYMNRSSSENRENEIHQFTGAEALGEPMSPQLSRTQSLIRKMTTRLSFFHEKLTVQRRKVLLQFLMVYGIMGVLILGIFSIYWGSMYKREDRYKNLRMLVVIEDEDTINGISPLIGIAIKTILGTASAKSLGNWLIQNTTQFNEMAQSHGNSVFQEIQRQVHHQHYWSSIYVPKNATVQFYDAIVTGDSSYNVSYNSVISYYETGRDFLAMDQYVIPNVQKVQLMFLSQQQNLTLELLASANFSEVFSNPLALKVAATPMEWTFIDGRIFNDPVLVAPSQVGLIYMIIITFFAFNFFSNIHQDVARMGVKISHLVLYRLLSTIVNFFVMSFFYSIVTLAFQVNFTRAFGHSGFLVYWMTNFLTMWAVGAMNESMGMLLIMYYPPLMGFWMLFWVIVNISPTFTPLALSPKFYRYGYGLPIHASYEITKVIFFDTYKGALGRNYGILVAWVVFASVFLIAVFGKFGKTMQARAIAQREKIEQEYKERIAKDSEKEIAFHV